MAILIPQLMMQKHIKLMTCECLTVDESALDKNREAQNLLFCYFRRSTGRALLRCISEQNLKVLVILATIFMAIGLVMFLTEIKNRVGQSDTVKTWAAVKGLQSAMLGTKRRRSLRLPTPPAQRERVSLHSNYNSTPTETPEVLSRWCSGASEIASGTRKTSVAHEISDQDSRSSD